MYLDPDLIVPDPRLSLREGAIAPWADRQSAYFQQTLNSIARHYQIDTGLPFKGLPEKVKKFFSMAQEMRR